MFAKNRYLLAWLCLQLPVMAHAQDDAYSRRCQPETLHRTVNPQGTMLWGTRRSWDRETGSQENSSVLVSAGFSSSGRAGAPGKLLKLEGGHLVVDSASGDGDVVGSVLQGTASDGKPVEVAICGASPSRADPSMVFYRIEAWNDLSQQWENPCVAVAGGVPQPRALAVSGVWDSTGARREDPTQFTFACENGVITKCIGWGYKPWGSRDGHPLTELHQACTRMARADYCGDGVSHTRQNTYIDRYDRLGLSTRTTTSSRDWDVSRASLEAAWAPDGATCMVHTRDGRPMADILQECPGRFTEGTPFDLGQGDRCSVLRTDVSPASAVLFNQSYGTAPDTASPR